MGSGKAATRMTYAYEALVIVRPTHQAPGHRWSSITPVIAACNERDHVGVDLGREDSKGKIEIAVATIQGSNTDNIKLK